MQPIPLRRWLPVLVAALAATALFSPVMRAQVAPASPSEPAVRTTTTPPAEALKPAPAGDDEILILSPFEVTAEEDTGYVATETLAGTRIRTDLRDVGSAITVITKEFMKDIGATDGGTLLQYTTNAEVAGTRGTYAGLDNGTSVNEEATLRSPSGAQRVRGLAAADNTRDFFGTDIPTDYYNIDRVDIQRGPNSILFGLGSPAGIVNASTRMAEFRNKGSFDFRTGSYGSVRGVLDLNQEIINDVLAIRLVALRDEEKFRQDPAYEDDERIYGALRFDPKLFKDPSFRTSFKVRFEHGEIEANRPRTVTPNDSYTAWFRPVAQSADNPFGGLGRYVANNPYDTLRTDNLVAGDGRGTASGGTINTLAWLSSGPNQQQPFYTIDGGTNNLYRVFGSYVNNGAVSNTGTFTGAANGLIGKRQSGMIYSLQSLNGAVNSTALTLPGEEYGQYRTQSLMDPTVFDFYNTLIDGPNKWERDNWDAFNASFSQTGWDDRVGLEVNYDRQKYERSNFGFFGSPTISIDITKNFADYYLTPGADGMTSITNPNFGRPFITSSNGGRGSSYESNRKYLRGSLFGEVRAKDFLHNDFLVKLLGKHRLNGVFSSEKYSTENRSWVDNAWNQQWSGFWNANNGLGVNLTTRPPVSIVYLGSSVVNRDTAAGSHIPGVATQITMPDAPIWIMDSTWIGGTNYSANWNVPDYLAKVYGGIPVPGSTTQLRQSSNPDNYRGWSNYNNTLLRYNDGADPSLVQSAQLSMRETTSYAASWQAFMWNSAIIPTLGWRYDEVKSNAVNAPVVSANRSILNLSPDVYKLPDTYPADQIFKDHSTSGGVVVHVNRLLERDRLPINVSLSYNKSNNFQVTDARRNIYGKPLANPTGATKDIGILLSTKDGKYALRAVKYETSVKNGSSGISNPAGLAGFITEGLKFRNVFLYKLGVYDWAGREQWASRNTWGADVNPVTGTAIGSDRSLTAAQGRALEDEAIRTWNQIQAFVGERGFFDAWGFQPQALSVLTDRTTYEAAKSSPSALDPAPQYAPNPANVFSYGATMPPGFTVTSDTESKGYEFELTANPTKNWRISFNASETTATRRNVGGPELDELIEFIDSKMLNADGTVTAAGRMPRFGSSNFALYPSSYVPWRANYVQMKLQEGANAPEIRKWRYNVVTNYSFREGRLKGAGVGGSYRWQDKVAIGYPVLASKAFDFSRPYFGPSEDAIDLWVSYERKLTDKIKWKIQLNVRNAFAKDGLIPISVQPDGETWASVRVKPNQEWFVTNTFTF